MKYGVFVTKIIERVHLQISTHVLEFVEANKGQLILQ